MSEKSADPTDFAGQIRDAYAQAIAGWATAMEDVVERKDFAAAAEGLLSLYTQTDPLRVQSMERWSKAMEEIVGSDGFAAASGQLLTMYAQQQQAARAASRVAAESLHIPTTDDLSEVARLVINVERKVDEVTDQTADLTERITAIEARLGGTADAVDAIAVRLAAIETSIAVRLAAVETSIAELARASSRPTVHSGDVGTAVPSPSKAPTKPAAPSAKPPAGAKSPPARRRTPPSKG